MDYHRRIILHPAVVQRLRSVLAEERAAAQQQHFEFLAELAALREEVAELRDIMLMITGTLRTSAEQDVAQLRRQLELVLARLERRPNMPLH
jgi:hypothetical protein